jgi:cytochrome c
MKITFIIICISMFIFACGNGENKADTASNTPAAGETPAAPAGANNSPEAEKGLELIAKLDCTTCHKIEEKLTGPAYRDVANKYTADDATITRLANKVITGGSGVWGTIPMTPHPTVSLDDAKLMVRYILGLKNK